MNRATGLLALVVLGSYWPQPADAGDMVGGEVVYEQHCTGCHGDDGRPLMPGVPDFSIRERLDRSDFELVSAIKSGGDMMPAFEFILTEEQILDVLAYLRTF